MVTAINADDTAMLGDFIIYNGGPDLGGEHPGGGIYLWHFSLIISNCTFFTNSAEHDGGMNNHESSPTVTNCTFYGNSVDDGGGIYHNIVELPRAVADEEGIFQRIVKLF